MKLGDSSDQAQAKAASSGRPAFLQTVEPLKYFFSFLGRDTRSRVAHADERILPIFDQFYLDIGGARTVNDRVLDKIDKKLIEETAIAANRYGTNVRVRRQQAMMTLLRDDLQCVD